MKKNFKFAVVTVVMIILVCLVVPVKSKAQLNSFTGDPDAPIDGGVSLLIAAGVGYGIKKAKENKRQSLENNNN
jgi:hypothetical protein